MSESRTEIASLGEFGLIGRLSEAFVFGYFPEYTHGNQQSRARG